MGVNRRVVITFCELLNFIPLRAATKIKIPLRTSSFLKIWAVINC